MKISEDMRFPHPVLWANTGDYRKGEFTATGLEVFERLDTGEVRVTCRFVLNQPQLLALVNADCAACGLSVACLETYYNVLHTVPAAGGTVHLPAGALMGRVILRPLVWAVRPDPVFVPDALHEEFGTAGFGIRTGDVLAIGDETVISVGREKLAPLESIFELSLDSNVTPEQVVVRMEGDKISITASDSTYKKIHALRGTPQGRSLLLNSIYLPAVMHVLTSLRDQEGLYEGRRWHRIFTARLEHLGISVDGEALEGAQKLLDSPFRQIGNDLYLRGL
jgi:hypothetical protein